MKKFNFAELDEKYNKKTHSAVKQNEEQQNFLRLYQDIPTDPKMQNFVQSIKDEFDRKAKNNRYYSYQLEPQKEKTSQKDKYRLQKINKLKNFQMAYRPQQKTEPRQTQQEIKEKNKKQLQRKRDLRRKFQKNVKIVVYKLKLLKMTATDALQLGIFDKQPYKFGKDIFPAVKQGNLQKVWHILLINKLSIFSLDNTQKNALMWACIRGHNKIADMLIQAGSDPNRQDMTGFNALYYAVKYNHPECIKSLMLRLIDVNSNHEKIAVQASQNARNVFNLSLKLMQSMKSIDMDKRIQLFDQQYKYLYQR